MGFFRTCVFRWCGSTPGSAGARAPTTIGPVTAFGSVFVGGTEFATGSTTITIDGSGATEAALRLGQVATVTGTPGGTATQIVTTTRLAGAVTAINLAAGTVTVLGQRVLLTGDTIIGAGIAPTDIGGLALGSSVLVDGYRTSSGLIASRFEQAGAGQPLRVSGVVSQLNSLAQTLTLGATTVSFASLGVLPAGVVNGAFVVANGTATGGATTLTATLLTPMTETPPGGNGDAGVVHGAITRYSSVADFDVAGQPVTTTSATAYGDGFATDLAADAEVEVAGSYTGAGRLSASHLSIVPAAVVRVVGPVGALVASTGAITVAGVTWATNSHTRWEDRGVLRLRTFGFANLAVGDWVEIRGAATSGNRAATAHVVERRVQPTIARIELQDVAAAVASPSLTLTGVAVDARAATLSDVNGQTLTLAAFFGQATGRVVRATGTLAGDGSLIARTVALRQ